MIISHKYKFIFIKTIKTAGTSIEAYLSQYCGEDDILTPIYPSSEKHKPRNYGGELPVNVDMLTPSEFSTLVKNHTFTNHMTADEVRNLVPSDIWSDYFKFCVERNPWDKVVSNFWMHKSRSNPKLKFSEYLKKFNLPIDHHKWSNNGDILLDKIIPYENLTSELNEVFQRLAIPFPNGLNVYEKSNYRAVNAPYQTYYTNTEMIRTVAEKYAFEIEYFGYEF